MRRRMWKWGLLAVVAALAAGGSAWVWWRYDFEKVNWTWGVVAGFIGLYLLLDQVFRPQPADLAAAGAQRRAAADELAELIRRDPTDEALLRAVDEPYPLPVRWHTAPDRLLPSWRAIGRSSEATPIDLSGRDGALWSCYRSVPSGRLLLLGPPGSGKSVIALRMARQLPVHREPDEPIPVLLPADSWDPDRETLPDWLVDRIGRRYPRLAAAHPRRGAVLRDLVETGLVIPVLDGLDEVPDERLVACIEELNALPTQRFVLTCRTSVYERYLTQGEKLRGTAVVLLAPPAPAEVADYLVDAAPYHQVDNWATVAAALGAEPHLTGALSTPLMVTMARSAFDQPGTDPRDLLPVARQRRRRTVEDDLLTRAVDAALRSRRGGQGLRRWDPVRAREYLGTLAAHLESLDVREFRWWQLPAALPGSFWAVVAGLRTALAVWLASTLSRDALTAVAALVTDPATGNLLDVLADGTGGLTLAAFVAGAAVALARGDGTAQPRRIAYVGGGRAFRVGLVNGLVGGMLLAFLTYALLSGIASPSRQLVGLLDAVPGLPPWSDPARAAVLAGVLWWAYRIVRVGLRVDVSAPADLGATSVAETVEADRAATVALALSSCAIAVLRVLVLAGLLRLAGVLTGTPPLAALLYAGTGLGLGWWLLRDGGGAWLRFAVARAALATRGRTPHRLLAFLAYAEAVGLLRQGAGGYRFRHARLQSRLASGSAAGRRGSRLREDFGVELARAGYWTEAFGVFAGITRFRSVSIGHADDLTVAALRKALLAGAAAGEWTRAAELLTLVPPPAPPADPTIRPADGDRVGEQRHRVARLIADDAPLAELVAAVRDLRRAEPGAGTDGLLAVLHLAGGDTDAALALLRQRGAADADDEPADRLPPIAAGLLARLLTDRGDPASALRVCHEELLLADYLPDDDDLLTAAETWRWSVEVMRRVTDERAVLLHRIRVALADRRRHRRGVEFGRRELAEMGLQACHALISHQTLGPLAVALSRRLAVLLADPRIVARTVSRSAPMWHGG
ncbi:NACHT domain-containing protein [Micromonospora sp. NPDC049366]|uniref:NACHT domain-containing protein n=1 Tax=Micromonospora sp. NPDC049366 TaxID=3364271 RepID=UPI0037884EC2